MPPTLPPPIPPTNSSAQHSSSTAPSPSKEPRSDLWELRPPPPGDIYDYSRSTEENYAVAPGSEENGFHGEFADIRATLDYTYHKHYSRERQALQDEIARAFLRTVVRDSQNGRWCERPSSPWVVFTAGAMGAGKSRAMRWVSERGLFPLASFVHVDPDAIRYQLPEMAGYLARDQARAGKLTQKEAGYIQEVLMLEGLKRGKNVMVDGSLRDAEWNKSFFARIRDENPNVKLAIVHVTAAPEAVLQRAERRAASTGRVVPQEVLLKALEDVPRAVAELAPLVDFTVELRNDGCDPVIGTEGVTWDTFAEQWVQSCLDDEAVTRPQYILKHGASREDLQTVDLLAATLPSNHVNAKQSAGAPDPSCSFKLEEECDEAVPASTGSPLESGAKSSTPTATSDGASNTKASPAAAQADVGNGGTPKEL